MTSTIIYNQIRISELENILDGSNHTLFSTKYSKNNPSINGNLYHNKKLVEFINNSVNFTEDFVSFQEKIRYYLLDKKEQNCCIICNTPIVIHKITCCKTCEIKWYSINPKVKESLELSFIKKRSTIIDGKSLLQIAGQRGKETRIKNGGYIVSDESKQKLKALRSTINPITGLTPCQQAGKTLSETMTDTEKSNRSNRLKSFQSEIVYCIIFTKEEWTRGKLNSVLLAEKLNNTIDPNTQKSLMVLKNEKTSKTKRKDCNISDIKEYRRLVGIYTNRSLKMAGSHLENIELRSNHNKFNQSYHVDHKFSVSEGFHNSIPPFIIGSIHNLQVIPWRDNISKSNKCSIDKNLLIDMFYKETTQSPIESPSEIEFS
ncbi:hypothetical protein UFOVP84_77 [uncultured Caudovirales phage]|uniref:Uncharacterized protein n=1 Tax=uncultured Caudovirales phage TaxID=2100421 RepID=A0A6J5L0X5_9CAUD|nr:hypothetical protein UFOVP84_77 [uncultured Caudovirales phage]